jgi:hypothetical protein
MKIYIFILFTLPEFGKASVVKDALISCHRSRDRRFSGNADGRDRWLERLMWRPPQKIKWKTEAPGEWPGARAGELASRLFSPLEAGPQELATRTWVPAMVPWRATDDGFVTHDNSTGTAASPPAARAPSSSRPPASATCRAARCCASVTTASCPACGESSKRCARRAAATTKLFIQLIDFLSIRRARAGEVPRPASCAITDRHRRRAGARTAPDEPEVRQRAARAAARPRLAEVLDARELEALRMGARERVTDLNCRTSANCRRCCPACSPMPPAGRATRASTASNCTTRTLTRWHRSCPR